MVDGAEQDDAVLAQEAEAREDELRSPRRASDASWLAA